MEANLRQPLVCGHQPREKTTLRMLAHLFFHPDSPRTQRKGRLFRWLASSFRSLVLSLVVTNLVLTIIGAVKLNINDAILDILVGCNTGIIIPLSCIVFTIEYSGRIWSIPESDPMTASWRVRVLWAIHILPLLELFAVAMMWVSVVQMIGGTQKDAESANAAGVARAVRVIRVFSKLARAGRTAGKATRAINAARATAAAGSVGELAVGVTRVQTDVRCDVSTDTDPRGSKGFISLFRNNLSPTMRSMLENTDMCELVKEDHDHSEHDCAHLYEDSDCEDGSAAGVSSQAPRASP